MRRFLWTAGMMVAGLGLGWMSQDGNLNLRMVALVTVVAGCIGYGLGSIFDQRRPGKRLIIYWAATLALISPLFSPALPLRSFRAQVTGAAAIGILVGLLIGSLHYKFARRPVANP